MFLSTKWFLKRSFQMQNRKARINSVRQNNPFHPSNLYTCARQTSKEERPGKKLGCWVDAFAESLSFLKRGRFVLDINWYQRRHAQRQVWPVWPVWPLMSGFSIWSSVHAWSVLKNGIRLLLKSKVESMICMIVSLSIFTIHNDHFGMLKRKRVAILRKDSITYLWGNHNDFKTFILFVPEILQNKHYYD